MGCHMFKAKRLMDLVVRLLKISSFFQCVVSFGLGVFLMLMPLSGWVESEGVEISFDSDIRPILSDKCYACHGPDKKKRKANLRLDIKESAFAQRDGYPAIVSGKPLDSTLYQRITAEDPKDRMPPLHSERSLSQQQIELLKHWIENGAEWQEHWSFSPPKRMDPPTVQNQAWVRNGIDHFILSRLEDEGIPASSKADKRTLIRRLAFDLTGLPPTPAEVHQFLEDHSPDAYQKLIDRLLAKPQYGEQMGRFWLDAARYGDTHGLHLDNYREIWPYRDWVIQAFNQNMPFDQFTIEQLAGDLLPEPTLNQRIATGFNRCNVTTSEGGSIDEEYYVRYAIDRTSTTSTVWLGLTMGCAVCHNHKFDPVTQKEFYQFYAYFNNITERAMDGNAKSVPPVVKVPSEEQSTQLQASEEQIAALKSRLSSPIPQVDTAQAEWETALPKWTVLVPQTFTAQAGTTLELLEDNSILASGDNPDKETYEIIALLTDSNLTAIRLEGLTHDSLPHKGAGRSGNGNVVLTEFEVEITGADQPGSWQPITFTRAWADHEQEDGDFEIGNAIDGKLETGWATDGQKKRENRQAVFLAETPFGQAEGSRLRIRLKHQSPHAQNQFGRVRLAVTSSGAYTEKEIPLKLEDWYSLGPFPAEGLNQNHGPEGAAIDLQQVFPSGDQEFKWATQTKYVDGKVHNLSIGDNTSLYLYRLIHSQSSRRIKLSLGSDDAIKVWLNQAQVMVNDISRGVAADQDQVALDLESGENHLLMKVVNYGGASGFYFSLERESSLVPPEVVDTAKLALADRTAAQIEAVRNYYRNQVSSDEELKKLRQDLETSEQKKNEIEQAIPTTLVMQERETPRGAYVLYRGEYTQRRQQVEPATPSVLPAMGEDASENRLGLARWLVSPGHPLTSRVTVNRFWQQLFGTGLVETSEDFGSQGQRPSHPELLDWLAIGFIDSGWDIKRLMKLMLTSATYRQSSQVKREALALDPENRLLSRGPRFRLDAEMLRDQALSVSGLLRGDIGGPSVKPPQPDGLWYAVGYTDSDTARFVKDEGAEKVHRRSLYTFWKRTSPPPQMNILDAPSRETCTVRRERTNTPLQALMLMNDPQYVEAARAFAERVIKEGGQTEKEKLIYAFELATARQPDEEESEALLSVFQTHLEEFNANQESAELLIQIGELPADEGLVPAELAAWTMLTNLLLNLDEVLTKG